MFDASEREIEAVGRHCSAMDLIQRELKRLAKRMEKGQTPMRLYLDTATALSLMKTLQHLERDREAARRRSWLKEVSK